MLTAHATKSISPQASGEALSYVLPKHSTKLRTTSSIFKPLRSLLNPFMMVHPKALKTPFQPLWTQSKWFTPLLVTTTQMSVWPVSLSKSQTKWFQTASSTSLTSVASNKVKHQLVNSLPLKLLKAKSQHQLTTQYFGTMINTHQMNWSNASSPALIYMKLTLSSMISLRSVYKMYQRLSNSTSAQPKFLESLICSAAVSLS